MSGAGKQRSTAHQLLHENERLLELVESRITLVERELTRYDLLVDSLAGASPPRYIKQRESVKRTRGGEAIGAEEVLYLRSYHPVVFQTSRGIRHPFRDAGLYGGAHRTSVNCVPLLLSEDERRWNEVCAFYKPNLASQVTPPEPFYGRLVERLEEMGAKMKLARGSNIRLPSRNAKYITEFMRFAETHPDAVRLFSDYNGDSTVILAHLVVMRIRLLLAEPDAAEQRRLKLMMVGLPRMGQMLQRVQSLMLKMAPLSADTISLGNSSINNLRFIVAALHQGE